MNENIAVFERVSYIYPRSETLALKDISLQIHKGEFLGLIGPTGAGKSTFCMTLNGIVPQFFGGRFFGHVYINGLDSLDVPISTLAQHTGMVFEDPETQITATSVENEIAFALENLKVPRDLIQARIPEALKAVRLEGMEKKHPYELSGGQKQRLAIAAALAVQPELLILDEPTSQLDSIGTTEVFRNILELNKELAITIVMASHAAEELAENADRIVLLSHGEIIENAAPSDIYNDVEYLYQYNLRSPQVAETFYLINKYGRDTPQIPVNLEQGLDILTHMTHQDILEHHCDGPSPPPPPQNHSVLCARDIHYTYENGTKALNGVSMEINKGEYVLIVGQNGAGKTTLVKHFLKLLQPTSGQVLVKGTLTRDLTTSQLSHLIGYVSQNPDNQIFNATVYDEVMFALQHQGRNTDAAHTLVMDSLEAMGLLTVVDKHPLSLPKGDRARVVIASILAMQPEIIIFDEPTTGQDYLGATRILEISKQLHLKGNTIVVITHHLYLMAEYAKRVIVMGKGTILLDAPIREAFHQIKLLESTYISPPQAVLLSRVLGPAETHPFITPQEVAQYVAGHNSHS